MSSVFDWRNKPSILGDGRPYKAPGLEPKRLHIYAKASSADLRLEAEISQVNKEVEHHFALAQTAANGMRDHHRDEARRLAAKVRALVGLRSPEQVARMEAQRGIS